MAKKQYLAIDIGNKNIKIVHGGFNKDIFEINEYDIIHTPINSIKDGKITNLDAIVKVISDSIKKNKIKEKELVISITGTSVITREIQLPKSSDEELENILQFEAQQYFPVDLENYVMDFKILEDITNADGVYSRILLVAAPLKQVDEYMKIPDMLKMRMSAIDLPANCITKFIFDSKINNLEKRNIENKNLSDPG